MPISPAHQLLTVSNKANKVRRLSREEIINKMENEQDAIVIKLLREIDQLKRENNHLRSTINNINKMSNCNNNNKNVPYNVDHHLPVFESDDESAIIIDNANLNLYTPSHSRRSSMNRISNTSSIEGHNHFSPSINNSNDYIITTTTTTATSSAATINHVNGDLTSNRRRRRTSSSIYHNIR